MALNVTACAEILKLPPGAEEKYMIKGWGEWKF